MHDDVMKAELEEAHDLLREILSEWYSDTQSIDILENLMDKAATLVGFEDFVVVSFEDFEVEDDDTEEDEDL